MAAGAPPEEDDALDLGRRDGGLLRVDHRLAVARELHVVVLGVAAGHDAGRAAVHGHELDVLPAAVADGEEEIAWNRATR